VNPPQDSLLADGATMGLVFFVGDRSGWFFRRVPWLSLDLELFAWVPLPVTTRQEFPALGEVAFALGVGQEPEATDTDEPGGQDVEKEPPDELGGFEAKYSQALAPGVILVAESDSGCLQGEEAVVGDGHTVGVASQVLEDRVGPAEGGLGVDDPLRASGLGEESGEGGAMSQGLKRSMEAEPSVLEDLVEEGQEFAAEEAAQHPDGKEEVRGRRYPLRPVGGQAASGHNAVYVRMVVKVLAPGVEDSEEPDLGPEVSGVGSYLEQGP